MSNPNPTQPVTVAVYRNVTFRLHLEYWCSGEIMFATGTEPDGRAYSVSVGNLPHICTPTCWLYRASPDRYFAIGAWGGPGGAWSPGEPVPPVEVRVLVRA